MPTLDVGKEQDLKKFLGILRENIPKLQEHIFSTVVSDHSGFTVALKREPAREKSTGRYAWQGGWSDIEHEGGHIYLQQNGLPVDSKVVATIDFETQKIKWVLFRIANREWWKEPGFKELIMGGKDEPAF